MPNVFTRLFGRKAETRTISTLPWSYGDTLPGLSGTVSAERALTLIPVYAAVRLLSSAVSTLPVKAYRRIGETRSPMANLPALFANLVEDGQLVPWLHRTVVSLSLRGNAIGIVTSRDGYGFPTAITWVNPTEIGPKDDYAVTDPQWLWRGVPVPTEDVVHIPWFTVPGRILGLSPVTAYAATVQTGLSAQDYARTWFANGGFPPGTFKNSQQTLDPGQADIIKARLRQAMRNGEPLVYGSDWDYSPISVPPAEAQFLETQKLTTSQIASIYGIPPEMIGGETGSSMTYANVEQQALNFATFTLRPWLVVLETAFSALLPDRQYVRLNADALIRADVATRWATYQTAVTMGARSINEVRALEDLAPVPGGDKFRNPAAPPPVGAAPGQPAGKAPADGKQPPDTQAPPTRDGAVLPWRLPA